jgi:hypothetical protein
MHKLFPRFVQFGPPRTGSTLVWNAMRAMMPMEAIPKRHDLNFMLRRACFGARIVCTVRDPLDAIASSIRRYGLGPTPDVIDSQIREFQINGMDELPHLIKRGKVLFLKYEEFYQDFDGMFDQLEWFLGLSADPALREGFKVGFSTERIKEKSDRLGGFENFSTVDHIHGAHVSDRLGKPGGYVDLIDADGERRIREAFGSFFETFGYVA